MDLNEYELSIAAQLIDPASIDVSWNDIAVSITVQTKCLEFKSFMIKCGKA